MHRNLFALVPAAAIAASFALESGTAHADPNDLALNRLSFYNGAPAGMPADFRFQGGCGTMSSNYAQCEPDNQLFVNLVNQLGGALAPVLLAPAGTIGYNGLYFGYEHSISNINGDGEYWHRGTVGTPEGRIPNGGGLTRERAPTALFVSRLHVRKAFPYGFELGLQSSYVHDSSMFALGLDIRWALFEGFRTGVGYLPDLAVRGSVNTLVGNPQLYLTIVGVDVSLSKQFSIAGLMNFTPYIGGQALMILGDSTVVDATPERSAYQECARRHVAFDTMGGSSLLCDAGTGTPMGAPNDSRNEMVFQQTRILRWRAFAGLRYTVGIVTVTGEFAMDVTEPNWLNGEGSVAGAGRPDASGVRGAPTFDSFQQWMTSFGVGLTFH
jgi:hypothetical protein